MDDKTLAALKGSIAKWKSIVDGTGKDEGADNCPLCKQFIDCYEIDEEGNNICCVGCPVSQKTGKEGCLGSPYEKYSNCSEECKPRHARAELAFLKSLLPEEERI